nr:chromatin modification-related protein EAF1 B-like isoform X1 [Tanacetum cinerariifolium]
MPEEVDTSGRAAVAEEDDGGTRAFELEVSNASKAIKRAQIPDNIEAGSVDDYAKQFQFHLVDMSYRPRKKKKAKHSKDHSKRRLDAYHLDSNGGNGLCIQRNTKKLKIRELSNNSFGDFTPLPRSIPSPVTPEMSDMANRKKFMDLHVPDCGKRSKTLKIPVGQPGSGSPWPLFEDQSLVVLVHDIGPNWGLISDAFNSSLRFKSIFRSSKECKERHKMLMDRSTGDGGDSSEDSWSSQPYPSTLPGIPEGSARQLFQRLQGPMEEDTLKSNFEKIIKIGKKHYYGRRKKDKQGPKHLQQPHSSHALALSRVSPNNLNGGPVLTPMDFCDAIEFTPDVPAIGYQGSHSGGLPIPGHSNGSSSIPVSSSSTHCSDFSLASVPLNPPNRDVKSGISRTVSLSKDDQQGMQQFNQLLSGRDWQHSNLSPGSLSGTGRGVRMLAAENGTGVMPGMNRSTSIARPGFDGAASPSMAMLSPINMQSMVGPGQGSSMLRVSND